MKRWGSKKDGIVKCRCGARMDTFEQLRSHVFHVHGDIDASLWLVMEY
jgi:hypothetical protein